MKRALMVLLLLLLIGLCGCKKTFTAKQFLFDHPEITLQVNKTGQIYNKYSYPNFIADSDDILIINIKDKSYEVLLTRRYQQIGTTRYWVKACNRK